MIDLIRSKANTYRLLLLIVLAYMFSLAVRMIWVYQFRDNMDMYWNGQLMINTNDGYFFASMAQKILEDMHQYNPRLSGGWNYAVVAMTVLAAKITPFSLETIILYMPVVISSLVVVPIILIGKLYNNLSLGFLAALLGSIALSYYNRTMVGYFDTDMFSAMAPMFILYFLLATIETEKKLYSFLSAISILSYPFLYDQGLSLVYAMGLFYMGYMLVFHRKEAFTYQSIILIAIALMGIDWYLKLLLILAVSFLYERYSFEHRYLVIASVLAVLVFLVTGNVFTLIYAKVTGYIIRGTEESGLHFFQVAQTVREAGRIPFGVMADRISGSTIGVIAALVGYLMLVWKHKPFILALPLIGIGIFSLWGGLRFTVYAVPVAALGAVFLIYTISLYVKDTLPRYMILGLGVAGLIYPNIIHIINYRVPTVFYKDEVAVLDRLKGTGDEKDYVITWWDYGYPIWFYANKNTLIDGGKHHHDNYIVSRILTSSSQKEAALLSRLAVETYVDSGYKNVADTLFRNNQKDQVDVGNFFDEIKADTLAIPEASRDVFIYLPFRMIDILPTVKLFSNIDLDTGKKLNTPFFYRSAQAVQNEGKVNFGNGVILDIKSAILSVGTQSASVNQVVTTEYKENGQLAVNRQLLNMNGNIVILTLKSYNTILVMDMEMYNSSYIQMFFLDNYDTNYFEPVIMTPWSKVYKVKS